ncbi:MAG: helix-turn-helix domain-containing protein [Clostridia bacterium]|nr:helix-turn-helix domain-containing protein [Clostridia bacterium]
MDYEFTVTIANQPYKVFLQPGFAQFNKFAPRLHKHTYPEIHLFSCGNVQMEVNGITYDVNDSELCLIPPKTYHRFLKHDEDMLHTAFQIDAPLDSFQKVVLPKQTALAYFDAIHEGNYTKIAAYISLICAHFFPDTIEVPKERTDYSFIISEFFSIHYNDPVTLTDLAKLLHLSEKQASRQVKKLTGQSFLDAMTTHRMKTAKFLNNTTDMSMSEIAAHVGYQSYSGFWKAYQKYSSKQKTDAE